MIPKKIHYCWFGPKPFPELVIKCIETWKKELPDYEFILWNEQNSPMNHSFVQEAYKEKKYAFVADYVRFWALYNYGGIYLDTDIYVIKSFNNLLNQNCFFSWETPKEDMIGCCAIGCTAFNPFVFEILTKYNSMHFNANDLIMFIIPRLITPIYEKSEYKKDINIFKYDYFYPFPYEEKENVRNFKKYITSNTYAVHLWNIAWGTWHAKLRDRVFYYLRKMKRTLKNDKY